MQVEQQEALQARIAQLEKRLKSAESQCQATTKEIWQMEVDLARMEERAQEAEEKVRQAQASPVPQAVNPVALELQFQKAQNALEESQQSLELALEERQVAEEARRIAEDALLLAENDKRQALQQHRDVAETVRQLQTQLESAHDLLEHAQEAPVSSDQLEAAAHELKRAMERVEVAEKQCQIAQQGRVIAEQQMGDIQAQLEAAEVELNHTRAELKGSQEELRTALAQLRVDGEGQSSENQRMRDEIRQLRGELEDARRAAAGTGELARLQDNLQLQQEKSALLQQRLDQLQQRLELSEEKSSLFQQKAAEAEAKLASIHSRGGAAEDEVKSLRDRLERMESRVRDADKIYEVSEQQIREAEQKQQESWQRVRDAEMRANQAMVENKKLADKLGEIEKRAQESDRETQRLAFQDPLTGLPNINLIGQYLEFTVKQCVRYRRVAALLVIDIDRFKVFNEAMGMKAGDELLAKVAERLQQAIRETDSLGRKGEDEFIILLSELNVGDHNHPEARRKAINQHVEVVANRVMQMMGPPFTVQGQKFYLHVSIGIAICPDDGETPQTLLENGDTAMYHVKETGRNRHQFYTSDLRQRQEKRLTLDMQLRSALERGEFEVKYHPVISLAKGKGTLVGVEALLRWNHRIDGTVGPDYFLPAAEESGMIIPIGQWVLSQTCTQMREWLGFGLRIFASINLSKRQMLQADLVECISRELSQNGIPPEVLYVEIAEGFNTYNPEMMDQVINRLGAAGIRIAIDDFGVGYSSLSKINLNYTRVLKIDRSIIEGCPTDRQSSTVCIAAINLASSLGLLSLAEGVENANQVKFLAKYGCALAQGYYFSEPITPNEITNIHRSKKSWKI
ncbi:EAL domain-containing protein [bacterium]|nr:EAL domain-containing protein [bacterium]